MKPHFVDHRREAAVKEQQAAIERIENELVFCHLVTWIDRTPDGSGARNSEYASKSDRMIAGQDCNFFTGSNPGMGYSACGPIAQTLHVTVAQVLSVHGQAWSFRTKRRTLIQIVDEPHERPPRKEGWWRGRARHPA